MNSPNENKILKYPVFMRNFYPEEKITVTEREISLCGYFVIITSERMTAKEALYL